MDFHIETDLTLLCRVCMKDTTGFDTENIFADRDSDMPNIYNMLRVVCAAVFSSGDTQEQEARESLGMPKVVCLDCKQRVLAAYDLHERCVETDGKLWDMIMIKQELQEEEVLEATDPLKESKEVPISQGEENKPQAVDSIDNSCEKAVKLENNSDHATEQARETNLLDTPSLNSVANPQDTSNSIANHEESASKYRPRDPARKTCELCATVCKSVPSLRTHMKTAHPQQIRSCFECDAVFFSEVVLQDHLLYHLTGRAHGCHICKKRFSTTTGLRSHIRTHTADCDKPEKCTLCDKSFVTKNILKQHMFLHTDEKPFPCERCPSRFRTKGALKTHMFTHIAERNTVCDICGARFKQAWSIVKHRKIHAGGERPFACGICHLRFVTRNHLNRHMRTHTGEKPYKCAYCDRAFAQSNDLVKHSKFHVGDKPYQCDRCDASFRLISDLRNHYKVHIQPGEGDAAKNATMSEDEVLRFTSVSVLNRRFEQEKLRDKQRKDTEEQ